MAERKFKVTVIESERGWGQKVDEVRTFDTYDEAAEFRDRINGKNTSPTAPEIYWQAGDPVEVKA